MDIEPISWKRDCVEYKGVQPCEILVSEGLKSCTNCEFYDPIGKRILIIKLGAAGDVLRTTPLLRAIQKKYGSNSHITWLTKKPNDELLFGNPFVNRVLTVNENTITQLQIEKYDILFNFEIDIPATTIATNVKAEIKYGYYHSQDGNTAPINKAAEYYLNRALSNQINMNNRKTYQEMMFEIAELEYNKEDYVLNLTNNEVKASENIRKKHEITKPLIGIVPGAGGRWPAKSWGKDNFVKLLKKHVGNPVIVLAGPIESKTIQDEVKNALLEYPYPILKNNQNNTFREYMSVMNACDVVITGDTFALHLAMALKKKVIGLFFVTPEWEVEKYGRLTRLVSPEMMKYFYFDEKDYVPEELKDTITVEEVLEKLEGLV